MLIVTKAELEAIAAKKEQYPEDNLKEIAFAGRSNVGKSSLLNLLTNQKKLARISGSPGKTRTINFYRLNDFFRIVDLPGYGYAKVSKTISQTWGSMVETYFKNRKMLTKVILLVDIRHTPSKQDIQMYDYLRHYGLDGMIVATKVDKISVNQRQNAICQIQKTLNLTQEDKIIPVSALKRIGHKELLREMEFLLEE